MRDEKFDPENEFVPVSLKNRKDLQEAQQKDPVHWIWERDQIKRIKFDQIVTRKKFINQIKIESLYKPRFHHTFA